MVAEEVILELWVVEGSLLEAFHLEVARAQVRAEVSVEVALAASGAAASGAAEQEGPGNKI